MFMSKQLAWGVETTTAHAAGQAMVTDPELVSPQDRLWTALQKAQLLGLRFLPNQKLAGGIVDFYCQEAQIAIVCTTRDGEGNSREQMEAFFSMGIKTLRFTPADLEKRMVYVLETIAEVAAIRLPRRQRRSRQSSYMRE